MHCLQKCSSSLICNNVINSKMELWTIITVLTVLLVISWDPFQIPVNFYEKVFICFICIQKKTFGGNGITLTNTKRSTVVIFGLFPPVCHE